MPPTSCPKCQGSMEVGVMPDMGPANYVSLATWQEGEPEKSFWRGMKTKDKRRYAITAYRCTKCGFLESYATQLAPNI